MKLIKMSILSILSIFLVLPEITLAQSLGEYGIIQGPRNKNIQIDSQTPVRIQISPRHTSVLPQNPTTRTEAQPSERPSTGSEAPRAVAPVKPPRPK